MKRYPNDGQHPDANDMNGWELAYALVGFAAHYQHEHKGWHAAVCRAAARRLSDLAERDGEGGFFAHAHELDPDAAHDDPRIAGIAYAAHNLTDDYASEDGKRYFPDTPAETHPVMSDYWSDPFIRRADREHNVSRWHNDEDGSK